MPKIEDRGVVLPTRHIEDLVFMYGPCHGWNFSDVTQICTEYFFLCRDVGMYLPDIDGQLAKYVAWVQSKYAVSNLDRSLLVSQFKRYSTDVREGNHLPPDMMPKIALRKFPQRDAPDHGAREAQAKPQCEVCHIYASVPEGYNGLH